MFLALLLACVPDDGDKAAPPCDVPDLYVDADGDGFGGAPVEDCDAAGVPDAGDCDDADATVFPGAVETCDGRDEDCDGAIDVGADAPTWHADADADGFGDPAVTEVACAAPAGFVADGTDCDDADAAVSPGAVEVCDGADQDCDGVADEDLAVLDWYADADADGYGDLGAPAAGCAAPAGHVADATDCDDAAAAVHPGATDACEDGEDADCDGADRACPGRVDVSVADADARLFGEDGAHAGTSLAAGDVDGDGRPDLLVGGYDLDATVSAAGVVYVWYGAPSGDLDLGTAPARILGASYGDQIGRDVASAGDIDGDGRADVLVGSAYHDSYRGAAWVVTGTPRGDVSVTDAALVVNGKAGRGYAGDTFAGVGDVDGDGLDDIAIGASQDETVYATEGSVYIVYGGVTGTLEVTDADHHLRGEARGDYFGSDVHAVGDLDGDGIGDLAVRAAGQDEGGPQAGAYYLFTLPADGDATTALAKLNGTEPASPWWASAGDFDGDGRRDVAVGSGEADGLDLRNGMVYLWLGAPSGTHALADADATISGDTRGEYAGTRLAGAGDIDADGIDDLLVGAPYNDVDGDRRGATYVFRGPLGPGAGDTSSAAVRIVGDEDALDAGTVVAAPGDVDGDGFADVLLASPDHGIIAGVVWFFRGRAAW